MLLVAVTLRAASATPPSQTRAQRISLSMRSCGSRKVGKTNGGITFDDCKWTKVICTRRSPTDTINRTHVGCVVGGGAITTTDSYGVTADGVGGATRVRGELQAYVRASRGVTGDGSTARILRHCECVIDWRSWNHRHCEKLDA